MATKPSTAVLEVPFEIKGKVGKVPQGATLLFDAAAKMIKICAVAVQCCLK